MKVQFQKNKATKNVITFVRDNQTITWTKADDFLVLHDLSHYTIEKTLNFTTAFYGMINSGATIKDFEDKVIRDKMNLNNEAWYAETLANLILIEHTQTTFENLNETFREALNQTNPNIPFMAISVTDIEKIRALYSQLIKNWKILPENQLMELDF
jgi:hypothetical protein